MAKRGIAFLEVIVFLSLVSVVAGFFGRWHYLLDLASHFRLFATFALLGCGALLHRFHRGKFSWAALTSGVLCTLLLAPYVPLRQPVEDVEYRLLFLNVLTRNAEKDAVNELIRSKDPDFVALVETNAAWIEALDQALLERWPHRQFHARSDNFGLAFYSKLPLNSQAVHDDPTHFTTPWISATIQTPNDSLRILTTHPLPPMNAASFTARNEHFAEVTQEVLNGDPPTTIVAGDFNCTPWSPWFKKYCRDAGLENSMKGHGLGISWTPFGTKLLGLPIDHILVGADIQVIRRRVGPLVGSDHRPVIVDFSVR